MKKIFITGGAGFIGSRTVKRLLNFDQNVQLITVYDNFSSGKIENIPITDKRIKVVFGDVRDLDLLTFALRNHDWIFHFASNPDIARSEKEPEIDFWQGTYLTQNVLEAARINAVRNLVYSSGSGVYGNTGLYPVDENYSPLLPISPYGASKLAGEALISAYSHMFEMKAWIFRFANVVGPLQSHGVIYDFVRKIKDDSKCLIILGNGKQSKSYIFIDDVLDAVFLTISRTQEKIQCFNVASDDYINVSEIASIVAQNMGFPNIKIEYTGGASGWNGDVPIVRWNTDKIKKLGWKPKYTSRESITKTVELMISREVIRKSG